MEPFHVDVHDEVLNDLRTRLKLTRWADELWMQRRLGRLEWVQRLHSAYQLNCGSRPPNFTVRAHMTILSAIANLTRRTATVVFGALVTLVTLLALDRLGVQFYFDPVAQVLGAAGFTARCLYLGSTPRQEIQRIVGSLGLTNG